MADNLTTQTAALATVPTASTIATDDVGGAHYQRMKLVDGTDGSATAAKVSSEGNLQTITPNRTASGTLGALNAAVTISADGLGAIHWSIGASSLVGTLTFETTFDGSTWLAWSVFYFRSTVADITNPTANDAVYVLVPAGASSARLRVSAYTSGSVVVTASGSTGIPSDLIQAGVLITSSTGGEAAIGNGVAGNALRVAEASDSPVTAALQIIDDWDETDRAKVNSIVGQAGVQGAAGVSTASTQRVAIATDANAISGTVTANLAAGTNNIGDVDVLSSALPTGAATAALQTQPGVDIGDVTVNNAAGASAVNVQDGGNSLTVDGSVSVSGAVDTELTTADLDTGAGADVRAVVGLALAASGGALLVGSANPVPISDNAGSLTVDGSVSLAAAIPAGTNNIGDVDVVTLPALVAGTANIGDVDVLTVPAPLSTSGAGTEATALRVTLASDSTGLVSVDDNGGSLTVDGTVTNQPQKAATSAVTSVASSATNVTLLASNAGRLGATLYNDSTQNLFAKLGATASSSSFTVKMAPSSYFEVPYGYTGILDGIWASANGSARLTEVSA